MDHFSAPKWDVWRHVSDVSLLEAVALSMNIEPRRNYEDSSTPILPITYLSGSDDFNDRLFTLCRTNSLKHTSTASNPERTRVTMQSFVKFACNATRWSIPPELEAIGNSLEPVDWKSRAEELEAENQRLQIKIEGQKPSDSNKSDKLSTLNQASAKFWSNAERNDRSTHPDNLAVAKWLTQHGFSQTLAEKAATIIRPEWAQTGRKPEE